VACLGKFSACMSVLLADSSTSTAGEVHIFINDDPAPMNLSVLNSRAGFSKQVPVRLALRAGDDNTIKIGATGRSGRCWRSISQMYHKLCC
jgi:hypothetical protein